MANDVALSSAIRNNLLSLQKTQHLVDRTQSRMATGLRVSSVLDDARAFFEAKALSDKASDMTEKKEGIDQAVNTVSTALEAVESLDSMVKQMRGIAISAKSATGNELQLLEGQFNTLRTQINNLTLDAAYQGTNLVNGTGTAFIIQFSTDTTSKMTIQSVDLTNATTGMSIATAANWTVGTNIENAITGLDAAISTLRGQAQSLGSNVALLTTRLDFTQKYVNELEGGAAKLTVADINEEGANLVALQVRQQLGMNALAFAGQAEQAVLQLFR